MLNFLLQLTETLCSLKQNVDRFAFSVTWELKPVAKRKRPADGIDSVAAEPPVTYNHATVPLSAAGVPECDWEFIPDATRCFKSIIHSHAALTYAAAQVLHSPILLVNAYDGSLQALLDDPAEAGPGRPVGNGIKLLASVARWLKCVPYHFTYPIINIWYISCRQKRIDAGALSLASAEVKFMLDSVRKSCSCFNILSNAAINKRRKRTTPWKSQLTSCGRLTRWWRCVS